MTPKIISIEEKKLIGKSLTMNLIENKTGELWADFMPQRHAITNALSKDLISMQIYPVNYFTDFKPANPFEKWAAVEVADFESVPRDMETFVLQSGLYAVFHYQGSSINNSIYQYIFGVWLPNSEYILDNRPHFEILGEKYKNADPSSEEEIWIPIRQK
ncbi:MAG: GyrI-like domain-containing protein [Raineya sp.]|nr:GyrI-like domain-containing protein [Raineya sp.]